MSDERLPIDIPPAVVAPPSFLKPKSADAKRTERNNKSIAGGVHPATLRRLRDGDDTCKTCVFHVVQGGTSKTYHKCRRHTRGVTGGPATDIRVGWPACELYEEDEQP